MPTYKVPMSYCDEYSIKKTFYTLNNEHLSSVGESLSVSAINFGTGKYLNYPQLPLTMHPHLHRYLTIT